MVKLSRVSEVVFSRIAPDDSSDKRAGLEVSLLVGKNGVRAGRVMMGSTLK